VREGACIGANFLTRRLALGDSSPVINTLLPFTRSAALGSTPGGRVLAMDRDGNSERAHRVQLVLRSPWQRRD
jgi:hypothetical protein